MATARVAILSLAVRGAHLVHIDVAASVALRRGWLRAPLALAVLLAVELALQAVRVCLGDVAHLAAAAIAA